MSTPPQPWHDPHQSSTEDLHPIQVADLIAGLSIAKWLGRIEQWEARA